MNVKHILCPLAFFLLSLQGFYFPSIGLAPFTLLGMCLVILIYLFSINNLYIETSKYRFYPLFFYLVFFIQSIIAVFLYNDNTDIKRLFAFIIVITLTFISPRVFDNKSIERALKIMLTIHISYFYLQFVAYYLFNIDVDVIKLVTGIAQKGWGGDFSTDRLGHLRRLGGLFNEPGTYATFIAPTLAVFCRYYKNCKRNSQLIYAGIVSLILTFSTFALIFSIIICFAIMFVIRGKSIIYIGTLFTFSFMTVLPYFLYRFIERGQYGVNTGVEIRSNFINIVYEYIFTGVTEFLIGTGQLITDFTGKAYISAALNDSSLFLSLVFTSGPILAIWICITLINKANKIGVFSFVSILIILISKISIFWVFTPVLLVVIFTGGKSEIKSTTESHLYIVDN